MPPLAFFRYTHVALPISNAILVTLREKASDWVEVVGIGQRSGTPCPFRVNLPHFKHLFIISNCIAQCPSVKLNLICQISSEQLRKELRKSYNRAKRWLRGQTKRKGFRGLESTLNHKLASPKLLHRIAHKHRLQQHVP